LDNRLDYAIAVLKPDGVTTPGVYENLKQKLVENHLELICEKRMQLNKNDVLHHFTSPFDANIYSEYMASGDIIAFLLKGDGATHKLREVKLEFRKEYGFTSKDMKNLLHTTDHGTEYKLQFSLLFPSFSILEYSQYADLAVRIYGNKGEIIRQLNLIDKETNLKYIGLLMESKTQLEAVKEFYHSNKEKLQVIPGYLKKTKFEGKNIELIGYLPIYNNFQILDTVPFNLKLTEFLNWVKLNKGLLFLNYLPLNDITPELLSSLKKIGLNGVQVYDPRRSLEEAELLEDIVEDDFGLFVSGGTNGYEEVGKTAIGKYEFEQFKQLFFIEKKKGTFI
jgi:nucleoside diphosphate kinase